MDISRYGEEGIRIVFGKTIDEEVHERVRRFFFYLSSLALKEIIDIIPSFHSCLIRFDSEKTSYEELSRILRAAEGKFASAGRPEPGHFDIPVTYGGKYGPDMEFVSSYCGLTEEEVIEVHSSRIYRVFAVGFMPGFPYLGVVDKRLFTPRMETPRIKVPEGSVGLAQLQTGIYPFESPAGWRIIGKTDIRLFDAETAPFSLLQIGDTVRFVRI